MSKVFYPHVQKFFTPPMGLEVKNIEDDHTILSGNRCTKVDSKSFLTTMKTRKSIFTKGIYDVSNPPKFIFHDEYSRRKFF